MAKTNHDQKPGDLAEQLERPDGYVAMGIPATLHSTSLLPSNATSIYEEYDHQYEKILNHHNPYINEELGKSYSSNQHYVCMQSISKQSVLKK